MGRDGGRGEEKMGTYYEIQSYKFQIRMVALAKGLDGSCEMSGNEHLRALLFFFQ